MIFIFFKKKSLPQPVLYFSVHASGLNPDVFPSGYGLKITISNKNDFPIQIKNVQVDFNPDDLGPGQKGYIEQVQRNNKIQEKFMTNEYSTSHLPKYTPPRDLLDCSHPLFSRILKYLHDKISDKLELSILYPDVSHTWSIELPLYAETNDMDFESLSNSECEFDFEGDYDFQNVNPVKWPYRWGNEQATYEEFYFPPVILYLDLQLQDNQEYETCTDFYVDVIHLHEAFILKNVKR